MASDDFRQTQAKWVEKAISSDKYCDAIFIVGKQRKRMYGFRGLLANISPVFEAQFYGSFREASSIREEIEYPTISPNVFECIIRSSMNLDPGINAENVMELIQVSQMLQIPQLQKECAGYLENNLNVDNVLFVLNAGYCLNSLNKKFYKKSQRIALKNASQMISNKGFYSLHPDLLIQFLKSNCFKVKEEHLWHACFKWAQNIVDKSLTFKHKTNNNDQLFAYNNSYNHNYNIWQKSLKIKDINPPKIHSNKSKHKNKKSNHQQQRKKRKKKHISLSNDDNDDNDDDDDDDENDENNFGDLDSDQDSNDDEEESDDDDDDDDDEEEEEESVIDDDDDDDDDDFNDFNDFTDNDNKDEEEEKDINLSSISSDNEKMTASEIKIHGALQPIIPYLRYALMDKQFFIDNVAKYLSPKQRDAVYIHYILPNRPTIIFNDASRIEYSNKKFDIVQSNVRLDKARMLSVVDDWWSHTNFATESPQWFVVKLPDPSFICTINWKNRWGDGETAKDIELQVSNKPHSFSSNNNEWITFWTFRSEKTSNWLTFQVPQNEDIQPSMYWRFVVKTLYGDNSCRCGLDQIKITCTL